MRALLGALLTGLMVLPVPSRLAQCAHRRRSPSRSRCCRRSCALWAAGQTINIMTLGGLALAVGVLVDEATVEIENIHTHLARRSVASARSARCERAKTAVPRLLSMLCILAVFVPSFFMVGVGRQLFVPLSLAVGFAMISSYLLSSTLVPVLSTLVDAGRARGEDSASACAIRMDETWTGCHRFALARCSRCTRWAARPSCCFCCRSSERSCFPRRTPASFNCACEHRPERGSRRRSSSSCRRSIPSSRRSGPDNVEISTAFIGVQPASYPINTIYLWTSGPQEAVMLVRP